MEAASLVAVVFKLKPRERALLAFCLVAFAYLVVEFAVLRPNRLEQKQLQEEIARSQSEVSNLAKIVQVSGAAGAAVDGSSKLRGERDEMARAIARADALMAQTSAAPRAWEGLHSLAARGGAKLVGFRTLAPETLAGSQAAGRPVFRTGVELTLQGTYPALIDFVANLERSAPSLLWGDVTLEAGAYPLATLKLAVYSLDTRRAGWLE